MAGLLVAIFIVLFAAGFLLGALLVVAVGIRAEDKKPPWIGGTVRSCCTRNPWVADPRRASAERGRYAYPSVARSCGAGSSPTSTMNWLRWAGNTETVTRMGCPDWSNAVRKISKTGTCSITGDAEEHRLGRIRRPSGDPIPVPRAV